MIVARGACHYGAAKGHGRQDCKRCDKIGYVQLKCGSAC